MYQHQGPTLAQRIIGRFIWLVKESGVEFAEVQSALALILWGLWLLNPRWGTFASSHSFDEMAGIAPESIWGTAMIAIGVLQVVGFVGEHTRTRVAACASGVFIWATITTMFAQANIASTGTPAYALFTISGLWALVRLARGNG